MEFKLNWSRRDAIIIDVIEKKKFTHIKLHFYQGCVYKYLNTRIQTARTE